MDTDTLNTYIAELSEKTQNVQEMKGLSEDVLVQRLQGLENDGFEEVRNNYERQDGPLKTAWHNLADKLIKNNQNLGTEQIKNLLNVKKITFENLWPFFVDKRDAETKFEHVCDYITKEVKLDKYKQEKIVLYKRQLIPMISNVWTPKNNKKIITIMVCL